MENSLDSLKSWIFNSAHAGKISINQLGWPARLKIVVYDYMVQVRVGDEDFIGHGSDAEPDLAIVKATAEAFERYCVTISKLTNSNGCAVHTDKKLADENALLELVERDCFLVQFIGGQSFKEVQQSHYQAKLDERSKIINYCLATGRQTIVLTRIIIDNTANILGLGIGKNSQEALKKSEIEALRQWVYLSDKDYTLKSEYSEIDNFKKMSFEEHGDIALTKKHFDQIDFIFKQIEINPNNVFDYFDQSLTTYQEYKIDLDLNNPFHGIPLHFVKASHPQAQELFTGKTIENINPLRIINNGKLNLCLHPFR